MAEKKERCPITEFVIFCSVFGAILLVISYFAFTSMPEGAPPLFGLPRHIAFGPPITTIGLCFFVAGIWLKLTRDAAPVYLALGAAVILLVADLTIELAVMGKFLAFNLISIIIYALPFVLASRIKTVLGRIAQLEREEEPREPGTSGTGCRGSSSRPASAASLMNPRSGFINS